jgi:uncharacterized integral membrane protein (TIGR00698 family)
VSDGTPGRKALLPGLALAAAVVGVAHLAVSGRIPVPAVTLAVLLGLLVANTVGVAPLFRPGLDFTVKRILRLGIILVGIRLSLLDVAKAGSLAIPVVVVLVAFALAITPWLARRLGVSPRLGILAAASTAICGVTATLAVAPTIDAEEREVAYTVANVTLYGLLGMLLYPFVAHALLGDHPAAAGMFLGTSIHDTSQVAGAAAAYGEAFKDRVAMDAAIVTKLVRNTCLVAVVPFLAWSHARRTGGEGKRVALAKLFPLFVLGFLAMAMLRTAGDAVITGAGRETWTALCGNVARVGTDVCLAGTMAALGLTTRFAALRDLGLRPLLLGAGAATAVAVAAMGLSLAVAGP